MWKWLKPSFSWCIIAGNINFWVSNVWFFISEWLCPDVTFVVKQPVSSLGSITMSVITRSRLQWRFVISGLVHFYHFCDKRPEWNINRIFNFMTFKSEWVWQYVKFVVKQPMGLLGGVTMSVITQQITVNIIVNCE